MVEYERDQWGMRVDTLQARYDELGNLDRVRAVVLPVLLHQALAWAVQQDKVTVRADILDSLLRATERPFRGHDQMLIATIATEAQKLSGEILNAMNPSCAKEAVIAVSALILKLADMGRIPADDNQAYYVLSALMILTEVHENPGSSQWPTISNDRVQTLITRAVERSYMSGVKLL